VGRRKDQLLGRTSRGKEVCLGGGEQYCSGTIGVESIGGKKRGKEPPRWFTDPGNDAFLPGTMWEGGGKRDDRKGGRPGRRGKEGEKCGQDRIREMRLCEIYMIRGGVKHCLRI